MNSPLPDYLLDICTSAGWTLLQSLWQFALLALAIRLLLVVLPKKIVRLRYWTLCLGLLTMLLVAATTFWTEYQRNPERVATVVSAQLIAADAPVPIAEVEAIGLPASAVDHQQQLERPAATDQAEVLSTVPSFVEQLKAWCTPYLPLLFLLWLVTCTGLLLKMGMDWRKLGRLQRLEAHPVGGEWEQRFIQLQQQLNIRRPVQLLLSGWIDEPLTFYTFKPVVLLPLGLFSGLNQQQVELLLLHELAHIKRYDFTINLLQIFCRALFFYHPAVYWLNRQIRIEREMACDDLVMKTNNRPIKYAEALLHLQSLKLGQQNAMIMAATGTSQLFKARIVRLFPSTTPNENIHPRYLLGLLLLPILALTLWNQPERPNQLTFAPLFQEEENGAGQIVPGELLELETSDELETDEPSATAYLGEGALNAALSALENETATEEFTLEDQDEAVLYEPEVQAESFEQNSSDIGIDHTPIVLSPIRHTPIGAGLASGEHTAQFEGNKELIIEAIKHGNVEVVDLLIDQGVSVETKTHRGRSLLIIAVHYEQLEVAQLLIERGAEVNYLSQDHYTPLGESAEHGPLVMTELLVRAGADVNLAKNNQHTPLMLAAEHGHRDIVEYLIAQGADRAAIAHDDWTAYDHAMMSGHDEIGELIGVEYAGMFEQGNWGRAGHFDNQRERRATERGNRSRNRNSNTNSNNGVTTTIVTTDGNEVSNEDVGGSNHSINGRARGRRERVMDGSLPAGMNDLVFRTPVQDYLEFSFDLVNRVAYARIQLLDANQNPIRDLHDGELGSGFHTLTHSVDDLRKGTYWIQFELDDELLKVEIGQGTEIQWRN
ncbi:MAG: M56 family metallopeptidase [Bacteroidota bacterium]